MSSIRDGQRTDFDRDVFCVLGLPFDALTLLETVRTVQQAARDKKRCFITTPNINWVVACRHDPELRSSVLRSDLTLPDGMPLIWAARLMRLPLHKRVAGSSLFDTLRSGDEPPLSVYFFGGADGVAAAACDALNAAGGALTCAGSHSPGFGSIEQMSTPEILADIDRSGADFLVVALSARKGQMWLLHNLPQLAVPIASHLGAVVNFVAGTVKRASERWQGAGLEWLWRIKQEPQLWRRYLYDGVALAGLLLTQIVPSALAVRFGRPSASAIRSARVTSRTMAGGCRLTLSGAWTARNLRPLRDAFRLAVECGCDIELDFAGVVHVDPACIGLLLLLRGHQDAVGRKLDMVFCSRATSRQFSRGGASFLLR